MDRFSFCPTLAAPLDKSDVTTSRTYRSRWVSKEDREGLMIVCNDFEAVRMLNDVLGEWGYDVIVAGNGWEALVLVDRRKVDGMLVDMDMPIMDGRTMLRELRWLGYQIPVLMMSNEVDERVHRQLLMEGAQGYCSKPFHLLSLRQTCRQVFAKNGVEEYAASYFSPAYEKIKKSR